MTYKSKVRVIVRFIHFLYKLWVARDLYKIRRSDNNTINVQRQLEPNHGCNEELNINRTKLANNTNKHNQYSCQMLLLLPTAPATSFFKHAS